MCSQRVDAVEAVVGERLAGALDGATKGYGASWQRPFYFLVLVDLVALVFVGEFGARASLTSRVVHHPRHLPSPGHPASQAPGFPSSARRPCCEPYRYTRN
jgi:hypothetical protein